MKRWITSVGLVAIVGCTQPPTTSVEEAVTDCTPGGNYKYAKLPPVYWWNGYAPPQASAGQLYLDYEDPSYSGTHLAFLVDPGKGYVVWVARLKDSSLQQYRATITGGLTPYIGDCCRPPPPPPGGTDWIARFVLEAGLRYLQVPDQAVNAANL